ncbi:MAG: molybdenum cofactor biosynthesis protein MoaE [Hyphomicrobiaceae bacterium]
MAARIQEADFDIAAEIRALTSGQDVGAVATFTGIVRAGAGESRIAAMTLEHYPGMTERALADVEAEACRRWPLTASLVIHRFGRLVPGDNIVLVITASAHREAAFDAARFLMDYLKTEAPFWKREERASGETTWVHARPSDDQARERWAQPRAVPSRKP